MAASVFYRNGYFQIAEIQDAHRLLEPILGASIAPIAFAIALLASGQSSTITGTLAGQIVMEGYLNLRIRPWLRRLITRLLAVIPAIITIAYYGENSTGAMLVLSQVILSLQLPFAIIPLIHAVADKQRMGKFSIRPWLQVVAWVVAIVIVGLNIKLITDQLTVWLEAAGSEAWLLDVTVIPLTVALALLLLYVTLYPWLERRLSVFSLPHLIGQIHRESATDEKQIFTPEPYRRIAIALDFSGNDKTLLNESMRFLQKGETKLVLLHVVESPVARRLEPEGEDFEIQEDRKHLESLAGFMQRSGFDTDYRIGTGDPTFELTRMINELKVDMVLVGSHGHTGVSDLIHGSVINGLRHQIGASLLIIPIGTEE